MVDTYKIATVNVNGVSAITRLRMLADFLYRQEIDILLLQEVTHTDFGMIRGYSAYVNVGTNKRGMAMLIWETTDITNITSLPSGRGMAAFCRGVWIVNIDAPSGSTNRQDREHFYNVELTYLLWSLPPTMITGGDFNCALKHAHCTGNTNFSKALANPTRGFSLIDAWDAVPPRTVYTHYTPHGVARLDWIYVTANLSGQKVGVENVFAASTDHLAVCLHIKLDAPLLHRGWGLWKMNVAHLGDSTFRRRFQQEWARWRIQEGKYPDTITWWVKCVKRKIQSLFIQAGTERKREDANN
jgi:endonuclease/exonuclease/phosphatase family metal-dependent hydrolase